MTLHAHGSGTTVNSKRSINLRYLLCGASALAFCASTQGIATDARDQPIDEIIVVSERGDTDRTEMSRGTESLLKTAGNFGDPLQALTSLPGITFGGGDMDDPVVRGSGPQDNLYLIDGMEVGYLFHDLSDSVITANIVHSFDLKAAAFGPEYGNATGGVITVDLRNPNGERLRGNLNLSMLKSGFLLEGPIGDNTAFYIGGRYNTAHLFLTRFEENAGGTTSNMPKSHDYAARVKWTGDGSSITLTAIGAHDSQEEEQNEDAVSDVPLGNKKKYYYHTQGLKYERAFENGGTLELTLSHTLDDIQYDYGDQRYEDRRKNSTRIRSLYRQEFGAHDVSVGVNFSHVKGTYDYDTVLAYCDDFRPNCSFSDGFQKNTQKGTFKDSQVFLRDSVSINDSLQLDLGVQLAKDHYLGQDFVEPRLGLYWDASDTSQFYARYGRYHQRPDIDHILTLTDTPKVQRNETSSHFLVGNRWQFTDGWHMKAEAYYKDVYTLQFPTTSLETQLDGTAYGVDLLIAKLVQDKGLYGWLALSYGKSTRKDRITGSKIDYRYNTPLSATIALNYNFGSGWNLGAKFRIQSGDPYTPVNSVTLHPDDYYVFEYGETNSRRTQAYQRLDVRLEKQSNYSFGHVTYYVDLLNVLGRDNSSNRDYPHNLVMPTSDGGWQANPADDSGIPFYGAIGVNIAF
ncbi:MULTISPECIES: TonB-dependent receptor plug domain-containing protein [Kordiimonas]|mgnify:CR=1 FL=1|jgi:hypothetical protein|uniref:TonB-dependent receptor plug domain-containing protein n=1 Tax=Kordiimonas TaxID=288021 RepID=UPI002579E2FD|nr:TonB-dependent receptor plug domain-containing protein [Kordiimonas sp. UBA4487]